MTDIDLEAVVLGVVEGLTEFLPVSSTGHLTIAEQLLGLPIDDPDVTAFTAVIQIGAIAGDAHLLLPTTSAGSSSRWVRGLFRPRRGPTPTTASAGPSSSARSRSASSASCPRTSSRPAAAQPVGGRGRADPVERRDGARRARAPPRSGTRATSPGRDALVIGLVQCLALIPGVSRSGATISAGLLRGLDRVTATRLSFFLSIPALTAAGLLRGGHEPTTSSTGVGWPADAASAPWSASWSPTPRSPGCCGSSPATPSWCSSPTGSALGLLLLVPAGDRGGHRDLTAGPEVTSR